MKEGMEITDLQVCLLLAMHMNPHERGYLHNYIHIEICKDQYFFPLSLGLFLNSQHHTGEEGILKCENLTNHYVAIAVPNIEADLARFYSWLKVNC